ncbi:MAG: efflux RND transporter periplasmic adaptor subunit, partial [Thermoanaerobaculia bacterium]
MGSCGSEKEWPLAAPHEHGDAEISHYSCSMHTTVRSDRPGTCPICSMDLVPVTKEEVETGVIFVDPQRRQTIGVRTAPVGRQRVVVEVRAVGKVAFDETRLADVSVKYPGWIGGLEVNATGQAVRRGQTLFTLYSPELYAAQEEFLTVLRSQQAARATAAPDRADYLVEAARERLRLWDLTEAEIERIAESGKAVQYLPIVSPVSGYVVEKDVVAGGAVEAGMRLYRIAALDRVWVEAEVYESELPLIEVGQEARVTLPYLPGEGLVGKVAFIYPYLDNMTRTGRVRIELPNRGLELKPDMYATVTLEVDRGERLVVAESAVLYAGPRRLVFLDLGDGRLKAQAIEVGVESGDFLEVLSGLDEGDVVVTSGTFLIAAESRLKSAVEQWQ